MAFLFEGDFILGAVLRAGDDLDPGSFEKFVSR